MINDSNPCELAHELDRFALAELSPERTAEIRLHLESCAACRAEAELWQELVCAADDHRVAVMAGLAPIDVALRDFWGAVAATESAPRRLPLAFSLPGWLLLPAGALLVALLVLPFAIPGAGDRLPESQSPFTWPDGRGTRRVDWSDRGETLLTDEGLRLRLTPGADVTGELDPGTGLRRIRLESGAIAFRTDGTRTLVVESDGLETTVEAGSSGTITIESGEADAGPETRVRRTRVAIREGRALLRDLTGATPRTVASGFAVAAGQAVTISSARGGKPELFDIADLGTDDLPPAPPSAAELETSDAIAGTNDPVADPDATGGLGAQSPRTPDLADGTVQIVLPTNSYSVGDTLPVEVVVGVGEQGLGAYYLELDFQPRDSDLRIEIVGALRRQTLSDGTPVSPLLQSFEAERQVLRVADTNTRSLDPLGTGTFVLLSFQARVLEGSAGPHTVGGAVHQFLNVDADPIAPVQIEVRNSISLRRE